MPLSPKEFFATMQKERVAKGLRSLPEKLGRRQRLYSVLATLRERRVFFYPASGWDWYPLLHLSGLADVFVYCDSMVSLKLRCARESGLPLKDLVPLDEECLRLLTAHVVVPVDVIPKERMNTVRCAEPSGWCAEVRCGTGRQSSRTVYLLYVNADAVVLFHNLFCVSRIRPRVLCLKNHGWGWTNFKSWDAPLARLARKHRLLPELLIADQEHDWRPHKRTMKRYPRWEGGQGTPKLFGR